jgi:S1-C subfamily serine protease
MESESSRKVAAGLRVFVLVALGFGLSNVIPVFTCSGDAERPTPLPVPSIEPASVSPDPVSPAPRVRISPPLIQGLDIPAVAEAVMPSVVSITTSTRGFYGEQMGGGSGVILRRDGVVVTNNHVIEGASEAMAQLSDGREFPCRLIGRDTATDLALLQMVGAPPEELIPATFGDSEGVRLGESVLAVGNPFGLSGTVTMGIVSALGRGDVGIVDYEEFIQTDAAINPGNSGGALVNTRGELIGINTAILSRSGGSQGIGFAIPVHLVRPITDSLLQNGRVERGWIGVYIAELNPYLAERLQIPAEARGIVVRSLVRGGPADEAEVLPGDLIQSVDGREVNSPSELRNAIAYRRAGDTVQLHFLRAGEALSIGVVLAPLPQERNPFRTRRR